MALSILKNIQTSRRRSATLLKMNSFKSFSINFVQIFTFYNFIQTAIGKPIFRKFSCINIFRCWCKLYNLFLKRNLMQKVVDNCGYIYIYWRNPFVQWILSNHFQHGFLSFTSLIHYSHEVVWVGSLHRIWIWHNVTIPWYNACQGFWKICGSSSVATVPSCKSFIFVFCTFYLFKCSKIKYRKVLHNVFVLPLNREKTTWNLKEHCLGMHWIHSKKN